MSHSSKHPQLLNTSVHKVRGIRQGDHSSVMWPRGQQKSEGLEIPRVGTVGLFVLGLIRYSEKAMATHSSTLAWKIPWMEEPGRRQSMGLPRVRHD